MNRLRSFRSSGGLLDNACASLLIRRCGNEGSLPTAISLFNLCLEDATTAIGEHKSEKFGYIDMVELCEIYMFSLAKIARATLASERSALRSAALQATDPTDSTQRQASAAAAARFRTQQAACVAEMERVIGTIWPARVGGAPTSSLFAGAMAVAVAAGDPSTALRVWNRHVEGGIAPPVDAYGNLLKALVEDGDVRAVCDVVFELAQRAASGDAVPTMGVVVPHVLKLLSAGRGGVHSASVAPTTASPSSPQEGTGPLGSRVVKSDASGDADAMDRVAAARAPASWRGASGVRTTTSTSASTDRAALLRATEAGLQHHAVGGGADPSQPMSVGAEAPFARLGALLAAVADDVDVALISGRRPSIPPVAALDAAYSLFIVDRCVPPAGAYVTLLEDLNARPWASRGAAADRAVWIAHEMSFFGVCLRENTALGATLLRTLCKAGSPESVGVAAAIVNAAVATAAKGDDGRVDGIGVPLPPPTAILTAQVRVSLSSVGIDATTLVAAGQRRVRAHAAPHVPVVAAPARAILDHLDTHAGRRGAAALGAVASPLTLLGGAGGLLEAASASAAAGEAELADARSEMGAFGAASALRDVFDDEPLAMLRAKAVDAATSVLGGTRMGGRAALAESLRGPSRDMFHTASDSDVANSGALGGGGGRGVWGGRDVEGGSRSLFADGYVGEEGPASADSVGAPEGGGWGDRGGMGREARAVDGVATGGGGRGPWSQAERDGAAQTPRDAAARSVDAIADAARARLAHLQGGGADAQAVGTLGGGGRVVGGHQPASAVGDGEAAALLAADVGAATPRERDARGRDAGGTTSRSGRSTYTAALTRARRVLMEEGEGDATALFDKHGEVPSVSRATWAAHVAASNASAGRPDGVTRLGPALGQLANTVASRASAQNMARYTHALADRYAGTRATSDEQYGAVGSRERDYVRAVAERAAASSTTSHIGSRSAQVQFAIDTRAADIRAAARAHPSLRRMVLPEERLQGDAAELASPATKASLGGFAASAEGAEPSSGQQRTRPRISYRPRFVDRTSEVEVVV